MTDIAIWENGKKVLTMTKEYIEREAAKARLRIWITDCVLDGDNDAADCLRDCIDLLDSIPAADVVPAVRCQDCVYARPLEDMKYDYLCRYWNGHSCNQNQFCSQGKRKDKTK